MICPLCCKPLEQSEHRSQIFYCRNDECDIDAVIILDMRERKGF